MVLNRFWFIFALVCFLWSAIPLTAEGAFPSTLKVQLFQASPHLKQLRLYGPFQLDVPHLQTFGPGIYTLQASQQNQIVILKGQQRLFQAAHVRLHALRTSGITVQLKSAKRTYAGILEISLDSEHEIYCVNQVPIKAYVMSVVGSETLPQWPLEALKAQAVLTQTALAHFGPTYSWVDSTEQQAYLGSNYVRPEVREAVEQVTGQILTDQDQPLLPLYHATCAGQTSPDGYFLGHNTSQNRYLKSVRCTYCHRSPFYKPTVTVIREAAFAQVFGPGRPKIVSVDTAQRPLLIQFSNHKTMTGYAFWLKLGQSFGWDKAPGTRFSLTSTRRGDIQITSRGAGHGVGLCQWGAAEMAREGKTYSQILAFYFPQTRLQKRL